MARRWRRIAFLAAGFLAAGGAAIFGITTCLTGERESHPVIKTMEGVPARESRSSGPSTDRLKVLTVNIAHGRRDGPNQLLQSEGDIRANLDELAALLRRERAAVVALQEADGPSFWSGRFDHVAYLADKAEYSYFVRGEHVRSRTLSYGTAILSKIELEDPLSVTFEPSPPTFSKGYLVCKLEWPPLSGKEMDIVSVHLDFSRRSVRIEQAEELAAALLERRRPAIVMGDFNSSCAEKGSAVSLLKKKLSLQAHRPGAEDLITFPLLEKRYDWILFSDDLEAVHHAVLPDRISDHLPVAAEIRWAR